MEKGRVMSRKSTVSAFLLIPLGIILASAVILRGQATHTGVVTPLAAAKLVVDGEPECLKVAREDGDPDTGPSTFLLEAAPGCLTPAHYHTAVEQFFVVRGDVLTGMEGMSDQILGPGGFAMMPSKAMHWFTCKSGAPCLMFVTFDRKYDIVWAKSPK
jgi:quercetin dioxygenase-like cupin family protein